MAGFRSLISVSLKDASLYSAHVIPASVDAAAFLAQLFCLILPAALHRIISSPESVIS